MKHIKYLLIAFAITLILSISGVSAAAYQNYVGFSIKSLGRSVNAGTLTKPDTAKHVIGVVNTYDARDLKAQISGPGIMGTGTSQWKNINGCNSSSPGYCAVNIFSTASTSEAYGMFPGQVTLYLKTRNFHLTSTYFNGTWYASETIYNQMNK